MKAVLLGYGTVGKGVEILCKNIDDIIIQQVFVRPNKVSLPYFSSDGIEMVSQEDINIVFECLNGIEPANTLITCALEHGKHVITSNKAVVSYNLERYVELSKRYGGSIQVEACVAGGIPFLDALLKLSQFEDIQGYEGIFNGTNNYILDQMQSYNLDFDTALQQAQQLGYAEANPSNDIEGMDVFYKANIANMLAYHTKNENILAPIGISKINREDIRYAKEHHKIIRHLAISKQERNHFSTIIAPCFLSEKDPLANVPDNYNAQFIYAHSFHKLGYFGQGAGQLATAQAMLANAMDTLHHRERDLDLHNQKQVDAHLLQCDWLVRKDGIYSLIEQTNMPEIDAYDMISIWRD